MARNKDNELKEFLESIRATRTRKPRPKRYTYTRDQLKHAFGIGNETSDYESDEERPPSLNTISPVVERPPSSNTSSPKVERLIVETTALQIHQTDQEKPGPTQSQTQEEDVQANGQMEKRRTDCNPYDNIAPDLTFNTERSLMNELSHLYRRESRDTSMISETGRLVETTALQIEQTDQEKSGSTQSHTQEEDGQANGRMEKRRTDFNPYDNSAPDLTFNTEKSMMKELSRLYSQNSISASQIESTKEIEKALLIEQSMIITQGSLSGKWKRPFTPRISTPQADQSVQEMSFNPGVSSLACNEVTQGVENIKSIEVADEVPLGILTSGSAKSTFPANKWTTPFNPSQTQLDAKASTPQDDLSPRELFNPSISAISAIAFPSESAIDPTNKLDQPDVTMETAAELTNVEESIKLSANDSTIVASSTTPTPVSCKTAIGLSPSSNTTLIPLVDYQTPQTFASVKRVTESLRMIQSYMTPKLPRSPPSNVNAIDFLAETDNELSITIQQNAQIHDRAVQRRTIIFKDENDLTANSTNYASIIESSSQSTSLNPEEARDPMEAPEIAERAKTPIAIDEIDYLSGPSYSSDDDNQMFVQSKSSSRSRRSSMSKLMDDSIVAPFVQTPRKPIPKSEVLNWVTETPKTPTPHRINNIRMAHRRSLSLNETGMQLSSPSTNSPAAKHFVIGKGKDPEFVLAQPKIKTYSPNMIDARMGVRRSSRNKIRPLRTWLNETPVYELDKDGRSLSVEIKDKRAIKYRTADPVKQHELSREAKERRKKRKNLRKELETHYESE